MIEILTFLDNNPQYTDVDILYSFMPDVETGLYVSLPHIAAQAEGFSFAPIPLLRSIGGPLLAMKHFLPAG